MMNRFISFMTASIFAVSCIAALPVSARTAAEWYKAYYTINTDTFQFQKKNFQLQSDSIELPEMFAGETNAVIMVAGIEHSYTNEKESSTYVCFMVNDGTLVDLMYVPEDATIKVGDMFRCDVEGLYEDFYTYANYPSAQYLGNGLELFGGEFRQVLRMELFVISPEEYPVQVKDNPFFDTLDFHYGDLTFDDTSSIMDVIALNRYLLGSDYLPTYSQITADTDQNGKLDENDSLNLLKYVVEIIDALPVK